MTDRLSPEALDLLRLTLAPGLGPVLIRRAIASLGSAAAVLGASPAALQRVRGIGPERARAIAGGMVNIEKAVSEELERAARLNVRIVALGEAGYPALLAQIPDAPPILYVRGVLEPGMDRFPVAIVGPRACSAYGVEQAGRFASHLARHGLSVVSGGARGIDTAAHRAALNSGGRTIAVLGCGLMHDYPPENAALFASIGESGQGAVVSELPLNTPPTAENFPARNRIISGLSLGVLVVEAPKRSGALITARVCAEDHGREVFAIPARVDSPAAEGVLELIKSGGAQMVTHPEDIIQSLESPARHVHGGTHADRFPASESTSLFAGDDGERASDDDGADANERTSMVTVSPATVPAQPAHAPKPAASSLTDVQQAILEALDKPLTPDELARATGLEAGVLRAQVTLLEVRRRIVRKGTRLERAGA